MNHSRAHAHAVSASRKRADFVAYLSDRFGQSCEFLTVVELAHEHLGHTPTDDELRSIHDEVAED